LLLLLLLLPYSRDRLPRLPRLPRLQSKKKRVLLSRLFQ
jgi:hypothetical protein